MAALHEVSWGVPVTDATFDGSCPVCEGKIHMGNGNPDVGPVRSPEQVVKRGREWIHAACAPGADDVSTYQGVKASRKVAVKVKPLTWLSGFCNPGNDDRSHGRCSEHKGTRPCRCDREVHAGDPYHPNAREAPFADPLRPTIAEIQRVFAPEPVGPGVYDDLDEQEYHGHPTSISQSGIKLLVGETPALFQYRRTHPEFKSVWDEGSAAHRLVLGVGAELVEVFEDAWRTNSSKAARDKARAEGKIALLSKDMRKVEDMAEALTRNKQAMALMAEGGKPEVSLFATDERTGVLMRGRLDWHNAVEDLLVDYKTTAGSASPEEFARSSVAQFGYFVQHPFYVDLARLCGFPIRSMLFIVQSKTPPYLSSVVEITPDAVDVGRARYRRGLEMFRDCTDSGIWPGHPEEIVPIDIPQWAYNEERDA